MEEQRFAPDPSLGMVNAELIVNGIQNCHMALEESRVRLLPLLKLFDSDDDSDGRPTMSKSTRKQNGHVPSDDTELRAVEMFSGCIHRAFESVDTLMVRLADNGLIPLDINIQPRSDRNRGDEDNVYLLMATNCITKATKFICNHCMNLLYADSLESSGPLDDHGSSDLGQGVRIQPLMARMSELALRVSQINATLIPCDHKHTGDDDLDDITPQKNH